MRSSTRATSVGSEAAWKELGFFAGSSRVKVPVETRASVSSVHSSSDPVHQWMRSGVVIAATSATKARMPSCVVGAPLRSAAAVLDVSAVMACIPLEHPRRRTAVRVVEFDCRAGAAPLHAPT